MRPDSTTMLVSLVDLAKRTGIRVRFDDASRAHGGGLCMVAGEPLVVLDVRDSPRVQAQVLASALARFGVFSMLHGHVRPEPRR
jgi:hypothetical protein